MERPQVSIITPSYNSEKFIGQTILSVQSQTFSDWEMIIVDDCSSDQTISIIEAFSSIDSRIKVIQLQQNSGAGIARNTALNAATGRYISFLDSDDLWKPEKLEKQIAFLKNKQIPFTFSFYESMDEAGNALNKTVQAPKILSYRQLFFCNFVGNLTGIYDSDFFGKIQIVSFRKRQDWILWLMILKKIKSAQPVPESLAVYRIRKQSISASKFKLLHHNFAVYRDFHRLNFVSAFFCMIGFLVTQIVVKPRYTRKF